MIISRTPLRISFCGGGSDLAGFYKKEKGFVVSTAINKYVYVVVHSSFDENNIIQYSIREETKNVDEIQNTRIKECMKMTGVVKGVEVHFLSEVPTKGTGLGGSSSFTIGLLNALHAYKGEMVNAEQLAREACEIEIKFLREPIGKQDQYIAAYGGMKSLQFNPDESVFVNPIIIGKNNKEMLQRNILLFYTGTTRSASNVLQEQSQNIENEQEKFLALEKMRDLALALNEDLSLDKIDNFGRLLHENWELKKKLASGITNPEIENYYKKAMEAGAEGGKILGAGGGGFLLIYCKPENQHNVRKALVDLREYHVDFEPEGSKIIYAQ